MDDLPRRVASAATAPVEGLWQRHVAAPYAATALDGRRGYGRWGTRDGFSVLYLGRPLDSVVVEAYRHLIDPIAEPDMVAVLARNIQPRMLVTATVAVTNVLDLREPATRVGVGLTLDVLQSSTADREAYAACQRVAQVAHQLNLHGLIAPAASKLGETLALFMDLLPAEQRPMRDETDQVWTHLPADPRANPGRHLRALPDHQ
jgi:hypothetical protein